MIEKYSVERSLVITDNKSDGSSYIIRFDNLDEICLRITPEKELPPGIKPQPGDKINYTITFQITVSEGNLLKIQEDK